MEPMMRLRREALHRNDAQVAGCALGQSFREGLSVRPGHLGTHPPGSCWVLAPKATVVVPRKEEAAL